MTKAEQFRYDFRSALDEAEDCVRFMSDGGTCNFDFLWVKLPRMNSAVIEQIAKDCDCHCYKERESYWQIGKLFGQGYRNTKAQEVMCDYLKAHGYQCFVRYCMD